MTDLTLTSPPDDLEVGEHLTSFFPRLVQLDAILRIVTSGARIRVALGLRGSPERSVHLDLTQDPMIVTVDGETRPRHITMCVDQPSLHRILLGEEHPGLALGQRRLLLKGSPHWLASFIPLFDIAPALYRDHLADRGAPGFERVDNRSLAATSTTRRLSPMHETDHRPEPITLVELNALERAALARIKQVAWALGYGIGRLRTGWFKKLSLFEVLQALSGGVEAGLARAGKHQG